MSPAVLLVGLLPHAVPELIALFLPLLDHREPPRGLARAARGDVRDRRDGRTVLVAAAFVEVYVSPHVVLALRG